MKLKSLQDLLAHQLQDLHSAEQQLVEALPKMAKAATNPDLKKAFQDHLAETEDQLRKVERALQTMQARPAKTKCVGMAGIIKEGDDLANEEGAEEVIDAGIIGAAQRVEHYEIAGYGTARELAELLGMQDLAETLESILEQEKATDEKLTALAETINADALEAPDSSMPA